MGKIEELTAQGIDQDIAEEVAGMTQGELSEELAGLKREEEKEELSSSSIEESREIATKAKELTAKPGSVITKRERRMFNYFSDSSRHK